MLAVEYACLRQVGVLLSFESHPLGCRAPAAVPLFDLERQSSHPLAPLLSLKVVIRLIILGLVRVDRQLGAIRGVHRVGGSRGLCVDDGGDRGYLWRCGSWGEAGRDG